MIFSWQSQAMSHDRVAKATWFLHSHTFRSWEIWRFDSQSPYLKSGQQVKISAAYHFSSVAEKYIQTVTVRHRRQKKSLSQDVGCEECCSRQKRVIRQNISAPPGNSLILWYFRYFVWVAESKLLVKFRYRQVTQKRSQPPPDSAGRKKKKKMGYKNAEKRLDLSFYSIVKQRIPGGWEGENFFQKSTARICFFRFRQFLFVIIYQNLTRFYTTVYESYLSYWG